ncbi:hypothetical protein ACRRTK_018666 [Alexandromys fortis]
MMCPYCGHSWLLASPVASFLLAGAILADRVTGAGLIVPQVFDNSGVYNSARLHSCFLKEAEMLPRCHAVINKYEPVLALSVKTEYAFLHAGKLKVFLADPSAFVAAALVAAAAAAAVALLRPQPNLFFD